MVAISMLSKNGRTFCNTSGELCMRSGCFPIIAGHFVTLCRTFCNIWSRNLDNGHFATCGHVSLTYIVYTVNHMETDFCWPNYVVWEQIWENMSFMTKYAVYGGKMKIMRSIAENSK